MELHSLLSWINSEIFDGSKVFFVKLDPSIHIYNINNKHTHVPCTLTETTMEV